MMLGVPFGAQPTAAQPGRALPGARLAPGAGAVASLSSMSVLIVIRRLRRGHPRARARARVTATRVSSRPRPRQRSRARNAAALGARRRAHARSSRAKDSREASLAPRPRARGRGVFRFSTPSASAPETTSSISFARMVSVVAVAVARVAARRDLARARLRARARASRSAAASIVQVRGPPFAVFCVANRRARLIRASARVVRAPRVSSYSCHAAPRAPGARASAPTARGHPRRAPPPPRGGDGKFWSADARGTFRGRGVSSRRQRAIGHDPGATEAVKRDPSRGTSGENVEEARLRGFFFARSAPVKKKEKMAFLERKCATCGARSWARASTRDATRVHEVPRFGGRTRRVRFERGNGRSGRIARSFAVGRTSFSRTLDSSRSVSNVRAESVRIGPCFASRGARRARRRGKRRQRTRVFVDRPQTK